MGCVALANFIKAKVYTRISNTLRLDYRLFYKIFYITYLFEKLRFLHNLNICNAKNLHL